MYFFGIAKNHWEKHHQPCTQKTWEAQERWLLRAFAREQRPGQNGKRSLPGQMVKLKQRLHVIFHGKSRSTFRKVQHRITHPETNMVHERKDFFRWAIVAVEIRSSDHVSFWKGNPTNSDRTTYSQNWKLIHGARKTLKMTRTACFVFFILLMEEIRPSCWT